MKNNWALLNIIIWCSICICVHGMNQKTPSFYDSIKKVKKDSIGTLSTIPDEVIVEILLWTIDWKAPTFSDAFTSLQKVCESTMYLYALAHERLLNKKEVTTLRNKLLLYKKMKKYLDENKVIGDGNDTWNALHIAARKQDLVFIEEIIPKLIQLNMSYLINEKIYDRKISPFEKLFDAVNRGSTTDNKTAELVSIFMENGAKPNLINPLASTLRVNFLITAKLIVKKSSCEEIKICLRDVSESSSIVPFIRENHICDTCNLK